MRWEDQGTRRQDQYSVVPRTLVFLTCHDEVLLLRGAPTKRLWANKLNGVGGHVEPGESPHACALREVREETGLEPAALSLRALVHISHPSDNQGVLLFVYVGAAPSRDTRSSPEGTLEWHPVDHLPMADLVDDLRALLPRVLTEAGAVPLYATYTTDPVSGQMDYRTDRA